MDPQEYIRTIATHYPDSDSIHRILEYADVDIINLDLEGKPLNTWFMALKEVAVQNKLPAFIQTIAAEYPGLTINEKEQIVLKNFLSKKTHSTEERPGFLKKNSTFLKIVIPLLFVTGYFMVADMLKNKRSEANIQLVTEADTTLSGIVKFITLRYKEEPVQFPVNKNILQLKEYLLYEKEKITRGNAIKSKLSYQNKVLMDEEMISNVKWTTERNIELWISGDSSESRSHVDIFLQGVMLKDPIIFFADHAGYISDLSAERTRLQIPRILGDHTLEIYFQDSLSMIPVHMEYSTAGISISPEEFHKYTKKINKILQE